jgi:serine/threonine protein kinase
MSDPAPTSFGCEDQSPEAEGPANAEEFINSINFPTIESEVRVGCDTFTIDSEELARGGFSVVYLSERQCDGLKAVCKIAEKSKKESVATGLKNEIAIHQKMPLNHPNIVKLYGVTETSSHVYFLLERCQKSLSHELRDRPYKRFSEHEARSVFLDILKGVRYVHSMGVLHRDIKPRNILLGDDGRWKICDFGLSIHKDDQDHRVCGTRTYMSPDIIRKQSHTEATDVWSLGVTLYVMLMGNVPFEASKRPELYHKIKNSKGSMLPWPVITLDARDLISRCLHVDVDNRPTMDDIMQHQWIAGAPSLSFPKTWHLKPDGIIPRTWGRLENAWPRSGDRVKIPQPVLDDKHLPVRLMHVWNNYKNFGFGYVLSTGHIGIVFKDGSQCIMGDTYVLVCVKDTDNSHCWVSSMYGIDDVPKAFSEKMESLNDTIDHFGIRFEELPESVPTQWVRSVTKSKDSPDFVFCIDPNVSDIWIRPNRRGENTGMQRVLLWWDMQERILLSSVMTCSDGNENFTHIFPIDHTTRIPSEYDELLTTAFQIIG